MKLERLYIYFACIAFGLQGCTKDIDKPPSFFSISGVVADGLTGKPLEGIEVVFYKPRPYKRFFSNDTGFRYSAITDKEGRYSLTCVYDMGICELSVMPEFSYTNQYQQKDSVGHAILHQRDGIVSGGAILGSYGYYQYKFLDSKFNTKPLDTNKFRLDIPLIPYTFFTVETINNGGDDFKHLIIKNSLGGERLFRDSVENRLGTIFGGPVSYSRLSANIFRYITFIHEGIAENVSYTINYERRDGLPNPSVPLIEGTYTTQPGRLVMQQQIVY